MFKLTGIFSNRDKILHIWTKLYKVVFYLDPEPDVVKFCMDSIVISMTSW